MQKDMVLHIGHNSGFFSCCTIALQEIMKFYNYHGFLPTEVSRIHQFMYYKAHPTDNLIPNLFKESKIELEPRQYFMSNDQREQQFSDYKQLRFEDLNPFVEGYFKPSYKIMQLSSELIKFDPENTVGIFHRANDKIKETVIATDDEYISKAKEVLQPGMRLFVLPDNTEFLERCKEEFGDQIIYIETLYLYSADADKSNFMMVPLAERPHHAYDFFASVLAISTCKTLITHSGNGAFWATLYRGNTTNVHQWLHDRWI